MKKLIQFIILLPAICFADCQTGKVDVDNFQKSISMALKLHAFLEKNQPEIALVGRVGSDLSRYGLTYSHMGIVVRDHPQGRWIFIHLLNQCGSDKAALFDQGLIPFFSDDPYQYKAIVVLLNPQLTQSIKQILNNGKADQILERHYNMLANPYELDSQNSNQWLLEVIASAQSIFINAGQRTDAQTILKLSGYQPEQVSLSVWQKIGTGFRQNVSLKNQNDSKAAFVSVRSIINYVKKQGGLRSTTELSLNDAHPLSFTAKPPIQSSQTKKSATNRAGFWGGY